MFSLLTFLSTHSDYQEMNGTYKPLCFLVPVGVDEVGGVYDNPEALFV